MAPKRNLRLNVERTPAGSFRARIKVDGGGVRGRSRETKNEAAEDALDLQRHLVVDRGRAETVREAFDTVFAWCEDADRRAATVKFYQAREAPAPRSRGCGRTTCRRIVSSCHSGRNLPRFILWPNTKG